MKSKGYLHMIVGPMFAGKSTALIEELVRYQFRKKTVLLVKFAGDTRYTSENKVITHGQVEFPAIAASKIEEIVSKAEEFDVIGIDEGQFFPDIELADKLAKNKTVVVNGLTSDFTRANFGNIFELYPKADKITHLVSVCQRCGADAPFSLKTTESTAQVDIGAGDKYIPVCRDCYNNGD